MSLAAARHTQAEQQDALLADDAAHAIAFTVRVRRDGVTTESRAVARDWFECYLAAVDLHGHDCRIDIEALGPAP